MSRISRRLSVPEDLAGRRLDQAAAALLPEFSRSRLRAWIDAGELTVGGREAKPRMLLKGGEELALETELTAAVLPEPEPIPLAILYADDTLHRLAEKSEVEVIPPSGNEPGLLKLLTGKHYFASRKPTDFRRVETATVTAAIKGTEYAVDVAEDGTTSVTMIEGVVVASNALGTVEVGPGERATAEPGKAPVKSIVVRPRDAVAWALYSKACA